MRTPCTTYLKHKSLKGIRRHHTHTHPVTVVFFFYNDTLDSQDEGRWVRSLESLRFQKIVNMQICVSFIRNAAIFAAATRI